MVWTIGKRGSFFGPEHDRANRHLLLYLPRTESSCTFSILFTRLLVHRRSLLPSLRGSLRLGLLWMVGLLLAIRPELLFLSTRGKAVEEFGEALLLKLPGFLLFDAGLFD